MSLYQRLSVFFSKNTAQLLIIILISLQIVPSQTYAFSVSEEKKLGEKLLSMVRSSFPLLDDPDISQYINNLGQNILNISGHHFFDYHFFVINNKEFNAFAAPSGLIFIHSGLIEAMSSEGELISVMAHECGHVSSRHISDRMKKTSKTSIGTTALVIAGAALGGGALSQALIAGSLAAGSALNLQFSRQDEEEADRLAFKWMTALQMDPATMASMLGKMHKLSVYRMSNIPPYLLTHPEPKRRMGYVQDLISINGPQTYQEPDNFSFMRIKQRILVKTKEPAALRPVFSRQAASDDPAEKAMAIYGLFLLSVNEADFEAAARYLRQVIAAYPDKTILDADLAGLYAHQGNYQQALGLLQAARQKEHNDAYITYELARTLQQTGNDTQALSLYEELLFLIPDYAKLHYNIGELRTKLGEANTGHYHLGYYFWLEGKIDIAKHHLRLAASAKDPDLPTAVKADELLKKIEELEKD